MNDSTLKKYLVGSLILHFLVVLIGATLSHSATIRHSFVVLGVHSKMPHKTLFKQFGNRAAAVPGGKAGAPMVQAPRSPVKSQAIKQVAKKVVPQPKKAPIKKSAAKPTIKKPSAKPSSGVAFDNDKRSGTQKKQITKAAQKKQVVSKKLDTKIDKKVIEQKKAQEKLPSKKLDKKEVSKQEPLKKESVLPKIEANKQLKSENLVTAAQAVTLPETPIVEKFQTDDGEEFFAQPDNQDVLAIAFTDREMLLYQRLVQQEIERTWQPPLGVPKGTECTVRFQVADNGKIKSVTLVHRSDVLIFDLSTLRSARKCMFAQCLWGKIFQVDFRQ